MPNEKGKNATGFRHSGFYHRYFQGYTEARVQKPDGGRYIERVYTAPWKRHDLTDRQWILRKCAYALLALAAALLFVIAATANVVSNYFRFVGLIEALAFICLILFFASTVSYALKPRNMTPVGIQIEHEQSAPQRRCIRRRPCADGGRESGLRHRL